MPVRIGATWRPAAGHDVCGDVCAVVPFTEGTLICLADGLGHGEDAHAAAQEVCGYARTHVDEPLEAMLRGMDAALAGMRGAAVSVLVLLPAARRALFAGVGNVELRAVSRARIAPPTTPGIVGLRMRAVRVWEYPLAEGDILVLLTDGISEPLRARRLRAPRATGARGAARRRPPQAPRRRVLRGGEGHRPDEARVSRARVMEILAEDDRLWASGEARRFAAELGFSAGEQAKVALSVAELASNAAKHAGRGVIELAELTDPTQGTPGGTPRPVGLRVRAVDHGPGIPAVADSLRDGFSEGRWLTPDVSMRERRGLGVGLGAVCRLMSEVRVLSGAGGGVIIEAVLRLAPGPVLPNDEETNECRRA